MSTGKAYNSPFTFYPAKKFTLIGGQTWDTMSELLDFVNNPESTATPGSYVSVVNDGNNNGAYWIESVVTEDGGEAKLVSLKGGGGVTSIDFSLGSDSTNAISLTINDEIANITVDQLRSSLGLQSFAYDGITASDLSNVLKNGAGISYSNGTISLAEVSGLSAATYAKVTVDKYGRVTSGSKQISVSDISDLDTTLKKYVSRTEYESDINDGSNGLATRIAKLESWFSYDENNDAIKTTFNFYSTKQIAAGGRAAITTGNLVSVVPKYNNGTLVATVNNVDIYVPATTSTGGGGSENDFWYEDADGLCTDYDIQAYGSMKVFGDFQCGTIKLYDQELGEYTGGEQGQVIMSSGDGQSYWGYIPRHWYQDDDETIATDYECVVMNDAIVEGYLDIIKILAPGSSGNEEKGFGTAGQVLMSNGDTVYWGNVSGGDVTIDALSTAFASGQLTKAITFKADDTIGILPATNNYCTIGSASKYFYRAYVSYVYTNSLYIGDTSAYFSSKTTAISVSSTDYQIPSAKAVHNYVQANIGDSRWYAEGDELYLRDYSAIIEADLTVTGMTKLSQLYIPTSSGSTSYGAGSSGQVLMSNGTTVYWGTVSGGSSYTLPLASSSVRGGIKIGASVTSVIGQYADLPVALNLSEQAYVRLSKSAIVNALGFTPSSGESDAGANPVIGFSSINLKSATVPNGVSTAIVTANTTAGLKNVTPEDRSKTCILHIVKGGSYTLSIPVASSSGIAITNSSGALATTGVTLAGYAGCTLVWNNQTNNWHTKIG